MQEVKYKTQYIDINLLKLHPENPRLIKDNDFFKLCDSIKNNPEYFETRPILVDKDYVIWAGNMRYRAGKHINLKQVPVVILDLPVEKLREIMIRDNVQNGEWDVSLLSSLFNDKELGDWGVDMSKFGVISSELPDNLTAESDLSKPVMKITFETVEKLEEAKDEFNMLCEKYGALLSVSAGEL